LKIALHDADGKRFPNLALMKLSAVAKADGSEVGWYDPMFFAGDKLYSSSVFTFANKDSYLPSNAIKGGTGYGLSQTLSDETEHICPDYDLYGIDYSLGFLTRGCPNKCSWCIVPEKEGDIRANADVDEFLRHDKVVLMDNNVLAHRHGIEQIEKMARLGVKMDFNQGLDARLIDDGIAKLLGKCKWLSPVRLACDSKSQMDSIQKAVGLLRWHNVTPRCYFCYVLVKDVDDALERVKFLKMLNVDPFAQPFRDKRGTNPTRQQKDFSRWVNQKAVYKSTTWDEYRP